MTFQDLNLNNSLIRALEDLGYHEPSPIQQKVFSPIMAGKDVIGIAQTGTGKTFAYLLPLLRLWKYQAKKNPEVLIIVPTRELVVQVVDDVRLLAKYTQVAVVAAYGGANIKTQMQAINEGADIVVATPGRLMDLLLNGTIRSKLIKKLVIDEVDEMLNLGFRTQLKMILDLLPEKRQNLMFSATITEEIESFIEANFKTPVKIEASSTGAPSLNIAQIGIGVPNFFTKINLLEYFLQEDKSMTKVLIFARSKRYADDIFSKLEPRFPNEIAVMHADKSQNLRFKTVEDFEDGKCRILVATDLMSRGLDISDVSHVINVDVPVVAENYIHRIGRTGRADAKGIAITFITEADQDLKNKVETLMNVKLQMLPIPEEVAISSKLLPDEEPKLNMKVIQVKKPKMVAKGKSHHDKKDKNKKVNVKVTRADAMKKKYGKRYRSENK